MISRVIINGIDMSNMNSFATTKGSGNPVTEDRSIDASIINLDSRGTVDITIKIVPDAQPALSVQADDNLIKMVTTKLKGDTLVVENEGNYSTQNKMFVELTLPSLERIKNSGTGDITGILITDKTTIQTSGTGSFKIEGVAQHIELVNSGTSDLGLKGLQAKSIDLRNSGTGDVKCWATESLTIRNSGTGDVKFWGNPVNLSKANTGVGKIDGKNDTLELSDTVLSYVNGKKADLSAQNSQTANVNTHSHSNTTTSKVEEHIHEVRAQATQSESPTPTGAEPESEDDFRKHFKKML
jgi:hypothetical protein